MVIDHHTAPAHLRAPTAVHFPYFTAAQTARRRAKVGIRRNGSSWFRHGEQDFSWKPFTPRATRGV